MEPAPRDFEQSQRDIGLYLGTVAIWLAATPAGVLLARFARRGWHEGVSAALKPSREIVEGRRTLASRVRTFLYARSRWGATLDAVQAAFSAISCVLFIVVSYLPMEPEAIVDIEDFFTVYFASDYLLRLWMARDSLSYYFSLVSMLDLVTVVPMLTVWLMASGGEFDTTRVLIRASIRVFRVLRIFRVIRVIRAVSVSSSYAFQRQVGVLIMTVLSMIFVTAGFFQIFESYEAAGATSRVAVKEYAFHRAVYYATVSVIGRPAVPFTNPAAAVLSPVFMTIVCALAATIIPTFVAELIRLWFDNAGLDTFAGNPDAPHVVVCGDTNVSRLRALVAQYYHGSRDADSLTPVVILAEAKPEGALRAFIEQYKHSGAVRYIRGSARRAGDLRRAAIECACTAIVLNYRADRDAAAADTEVLSTVMAIKNMHAGLRVLVQLHRPRKRNHLKAVPGWADSDKSVSAIALGMTLVGLGTAVPGFATLVTNLIRRGTTLAGARARSSLRAAALPWWHVILYGDAAKPAVKAAVEDILQRQADRKAPKTPLHEYADSIDQTLHEFEVTPGLAGRTFATAARLAYLRYNVTLVGATVPINDDVAALVPGLPRTFKVQLFPADAVLVAGGKLYATCADEGDLHALRWETGGGEPHALVAAFRTVKEDLRAAFTLPQGAALSSASGSGVDDADAERGAAGGAAGAPSGVSAALERLPAWLGGHGITEAAYTHNHAAATDVSVPWCFHESPGGADILARLRHIPAFNRFGQRDPAQDGCAGCRAPRVPPPAAAADVLRIGGITTFALPAGAAAASAQPSDGVDVGATSSDVGAPAPAAAPAAAGDATPSAVTAIAAMTESAIARRKRSFGDDGLGGIDDTDDVTGTRGALHTVAPSVAHFGSIAATAAAAARVNMNALAVRLALPVAAAGSDVEGMAAEADSRGSAFAGHVLVCGASDSVGFLLRAIASIAPSAAARASAGAPPPAPTRATPADWVEGAQYALAPADVVVLAPARPADAAINAMYAGSSRLLAGVTFLAGAPSEAADLIRAGVMTARAAVILTGSKATASADGADNLSDDTDAIITAATIFRLNPHLHVITELLHGAHAPFIRPIGVSLNEAQRAAFVFVLEEREAARQRGKIEAAIHRLAEEHISRAAAAAAGGGGGGRDGAQSWTPFGDEASGGGAGTGAAAAALVDVRAPHRASILLTKLYKQRLRLRTAGAAFLRGAAPAAGAGAGATPRLTERGRSARGDDGGARFGGAMAALDERTAPARAAAAGGGDSGGDIDALASAGLSNSAIVDVLVGVREDFGGAEGGGGGGGGGGAGGAGASKGSGATNDLFAAPAFAAGRVVCLNMMDSIICEAHFQPFMPAVLKQLVRAARKRRLVALPVTDARVLAELAAAAATGAAAAPTTAAAAVRLAAELRDAYLSELAHAVLDAARARRAGDADAAAGGGADAPARAPAAALTYGELYDVLVRVWRLLPLGLYRRAHPATGLRVSPQTHGALQVAAGPPADGAAFAHNRTLVSYVYTNPPPHTLLGEHDLLYVLRPHDPRDAGDDVESDDDDDGGDAARG